MVNALLKSEESKRIEALAAALLQGHVNTFNQWEVLQSIIFNEHIQLQEADLQDISGILYKDGGQWMIVLNKNDSPTRKLFTLAHELGHYFLHKDIHTKFIDSQFVNPQYHRTEETKYHELELEANEFAGNLIMPSVEIKKELIECRDNKIDPNKVKSLADKFHVSVLAMETRLRNLGYDIN